MLVQWHSFLTIVLYHFKVAMERHISQPIFLSILALLVSICTALDLMQLFTFIRYIGDPLDYFEHTWHNAFFNKMKDKRQGLPSADEVKKWDAMLDGTKLSQQ